MTPTLDDLLHEAVDIAHDYDHAEPQEWLGLVCQFESVWDDIERECRKQGVSLQSVQTRYNAERTR